MMKFQKYNSIENSYRTKAINTIVEQGKAGGIWTVSEKIHGANLSLWYDGQKLKVAKRSAFLNEDATGFFRADVIRMDHKEKIKEIWKYIKIGRNDLSEIVLYGEIFGGMYEHPDVQRDHQSIRVQKEVQYAPGNHFYCYDISINGEFINQDVVEMICNNMGIFYAEPLFTGTFQECLEYPNIFPTTIPGKFDLPDIEGNVCEGVVIKPVIPQYFWNGSRVILKNKNDKFKEKHDKGGKNKKPKVKAPIEFSPEAEKMKDEMLLYVTENRLRNVLSKIGQITDKQFGLVMGQFNQDIFTDFLKDNKEEFTSLDKAERKSIQKFVGSQAALLLRKNFLNIIDNTW